MANGGKRKGAGRKPGALSKKTLEQKAIQEAFNQRVMTHADALFNAQLSLAVGSLQVFRVDEVGSGKDKKRVHTPIHGEETIKKVLDETDGAGGATIDNEYYFVTNIPPDNKAIDSMLNRALGKPKDSMDLTSGGEKLKTVTFQIAGSGIKKDA